MKQNAMVENAGREGLKQRIAEMKQFLAEQTEQIEEYDESLVRRMVESIMVYEDSSRLSLNPAQAWMSTDNKYAKS